MRTGSLPPFFHTFWYCWLSAPRPRNIGFPDSYVFFDFALSASSIRATTVKETFGHREKEYDRRLKYFFFFARYHPIIHRIYREGDAAARLLFTIGNEAVMKISQHALAIAIDQLFLKGRPRECVEDLEKICRQTVRRCVATYFQVTPINV